MDAVRAILDECFWGDYRLSEEEVSRRLAEADVEFERFIASRILADSPFPGGRLKALFPEQRLRSLLGELEVSGRVKKRLMLVRASLFGERLPWEPSWIRI